MGHACTEQFYEEVLMNGFVSDDLTTKVYLYDISGLVILAIVCHKLSMNNLNLNLGHFHKNSIYTPFKPNSSPLNFTGETSFSPGKRPVWKVGGEKFTGERRVTSPVNFSTYRGG